ncbi:MAG: maleylacetoacetate isomerase [Pseudomonadota bacterium]|nr:maleylacetoacetate isomerase [Pseudomonadota bacterium]
MTLYTYYRSSCSYRVRIALALKELEFEPHYVHLLRSGGQNWKPDYLQQNPQGLVPTLADGQRVLTQSLAIIEYLDEAYPEPPLLPEDARDRAYVRALAQIIACDIQPLNNLRVLDYLKRVFTANEQQTLAWYRHWLSEGLRTVESLLSSHEQANSCCCYSDALTLADISLIPQVYSAKRFHCDLEPFARVRKIYECCTALPAFQAAAPENQGDAE